MQTQTHSEGQGLVSVVEKLEPCALRLETQNATHTVEDSTSLLRKSNTGFHFWDSPPGKGKQGPGEVSDRHVHGSTTHGSPTVGAAQSSIHG